MSTSHTKPCCGPTCCTPADTSAKLPVDHEAVRSKVREGYGRIAREGTWSPALDAMPADVNTADSPCCGNSSGGGCCGPAALTPDQLAAAIGYTPEELHTTPESANMGLSCGNPTALASLRPGEVVLDLGSGGGFDCFIAGPKVGPTGQVIGVDMTPDMLSKARRNLAWYRDKTGLNNVDFRLGEIEHLPVADASVDVVISNCVLNLSPDKAQVWREIARVLRPDGRVAVSDLALLRPLPDSVREDVEALIGCIAGAALVDETRAWARAAGLTDIVLTPKPQYAEAMADWQDPLFQRIVVRLPRGMKASDYITSLDVSARRP